jgi:hypothetical protein
MFILIEQYDDIKVEHAILQDWHRKDAFAAKEYYKSWIGGDVGKAERLLEISVADGAVNQTAGAQVHDILNRYLGPILQMDLVKKMSLDERLDVLADIAKMKFS